MVRADPSLLGERKRPSAESGKKNVAAFYISSANWSLLFLFSRFFCECVIREIEYGRDWDFGGLLRDCSRANPTDCIRFEQQLFYPNPCCGPPTASTTFTLIFSFPFIRHTLVISHKFQIVNKQWSLRHGVFSCCLRTYNVMKTLKRNGVEQTGQWNIRPAKRTITKWGSGGSLQRRWCLWHQLLGPESCPVVELQRQRISKFGLNCMGFF